MKYTNKKVVEIFKEAELLTVVSFDEKNENRHSTYSGLNPFIALHEVQLQLYMGRKVIITNDQGDKDITRFEMYQKRRITYKEAIKFSIRPDDFLIY